MGAVSTPAPPAVGRFGRLARSLPDAKLVQRVRAGDESAFEVVFDRYHRQLLAFCRHMLGSREEAEDALQRVFVSAHRHLISGEDRVAELRPWLYAIARNRCLSVLRARREALALDDVPEPTGDGLAVGDEIEQRDDLKAVLADMARLPDEQRAALVLSELGDLSHDEVAGVLGVRRDKVKALVFQARESLAAYREARNTDCREIREQLATLRGGALRRGPLRKHLETCDGCRAFRDDVRHQREAMALLLPVVPSVALKAKVLGAVTASQLVPVAGGVGAGVGAGLAGTSGAAAGGSLAGLAGGLAGKALVVAAITGTAGGGYAIVKDTAAPKPAEPAVRLVGPEQARGAVAPTPTAAPTPPAATPAAASSGSATSQAARRRAAERNAAKTVGAKSTATPAADRGRPAVPGANGLNRAPKAQGLQHRRTDPPAYGAGGKRGSSSAAGKGGASHATTTRPARPVKPVHPARPVTPPKAAKPRPATGSGSSGTAREKGTGRTNGQPASGPADGVIGAVQGPAQNRGNSAVDAVGKAAKP